MILNYKLFESNESLLDDLCTIKVDYPEADFWLVRSHTDKGVGEPKKKYNKDYIGIKVVRTDILLPDYLYYVMIYIYNSGYYANLGGYATNLHHIKVSDIKNIILK